MSRSLIRGGSEVTNSQRKAIVGLDNITEYIEIWTGKKGGTGWPAYVNGDASGYGTTKWYSLSVEEGSQKGVSVYTARASDRFDSDKWKWSVNYGVENVISGISSTSFSFPFGASTLKAVFGGTLLHKPYVCPIVSRVSFYTVAPAALAGSVGGPSGCPLTYTTPGQPGFLTGIYPDNPTWGFMKSAATPVLTELGWQMNEVWQWMVISGAA